MYLSILCGETKLRFIIVPYKVGSATAKAIKDKLIELGHKALVIRANSPTFKKKQTDVIIYYGKTSHLLTGDNLSFNKHPELATNKLESFRALTDAGLSTVPWTEYKNDITEDWKQIVARATLTGHSGDGISIYNYGDVLPDVPLYTKYVKKTYECRVHVFKGKVIDAQIKRKVRDVEDNNPLIRNIHTGWVYCRDGYEPDPRGNELAIQAVEALGLDFGAVDLIYNQHYNQFYILEVNTAAGLTGTTLTNFTNALLENV